MAGPGQGADRTLSREDMRALKGLMTGVIFMQLLTPLLQTGTAVILPAMGEHYACSATELGLVSTVYCMALAIFNLSMGRAGDKWGRRRVCLFSMVVLVPTALLTAFMPNIQAVIGLRFLQGMGTAAFSTSSLAMLMAMAPVSSRGRIIGTTSTATYLGLALGPVFAGFINDLFGWTYYFYVMSAWAAVCFVIMAHFVKREWREEADRPYDWGGLLLFAAGMILLVQGFVGPMDDGARVFPVAGGFIATLVFLVHEYRLKSIPPLLDVRVLVHNRLFILSNIASFSLYASLFSFTFFFSLYLQYAKGFDSSTAGLVIFVQPLTQMLFTWPSGWISDKLGATPVALAGNVLALASLSLALFLDAASPAWQIFAILFLNGLGMGFFVIPNTVLIMTSVDPAHLSQASGAVGTVRTGGMVMSMVIATLIVRLFMGDAPMAAQASDKLVSAMHGSFLVFAVLCAASCLCSVARFTGQKRAS